MFFLQFGPDGALVGRYITVVNGEQAIPNDAISVAGALYLQTVREKDGIWKRDPETGDIAKHPFPPPPPEEIEAQKVAIVQQHLDDAARALRYDDIKTAVTYADEPSIPKFQAEGLAFRAWRSLVWAKCYEILDEVQAGNRPIPSDDELIGELPELVI